MRKFDLPGRSVSLASRGMVATSNPHAAQAGLDVLRAGGNAVDAAVAVAALLAVVEPTQTGIGGDCFALVKRRGQPPIAINGSGWAGSRADAQGLRQRGQLEIRPDSVDAVTVPGAVRAWETLLQDHGTMSLREVLEPAITAAELGYLVAERLARDWALQAAKIGRTSIGAELFLARGRAPSVGERHHNHRLAKALRSIAKGGADAFYEGWIAEEIVAFVGEQGGHLTLEDFAQFRAEYVQPVSTGYRGYRLWECPPNGQGVVALQIAAMLEKLELATLDPLGAARFHLQAEVSRLAYAQRDAQLCDPRFHACAIDDWLSTERLESLLGRVDPHRRIEDLSPAALPEHRDTVFIAVADASGTLVSFINSIFDDFGSGLVVPGCGVVLHNRGSGFSLERGHPNELQPRKRPMHTIIPALLTKADEGVMTFGMTGGHFQAAGQLQVLVNILDYGMSVQEAIEHPRMFARGDLFHVERPVPESVRRGLRQLGHAPSLAPHPLGTCHAIWVDHERGIFIGGSDGRRDGMAIGY